MATKPRYVPMPSDPAGEAKAREATQRQNESIAEEKAQLPPEAIGAEVDREEITTGTPFMKRGVLYVDVRAVVVAIDRFGRKWRNERSYTMRLYPE